MDQAGWVTRKIEKTSYLTGKTHTREISAPESEWARFDEGIAFIQDALRSVSSDDREFLLTGSTPEEWNNLFGENPE